MLSDAAMGTTLSVCATVFFSYWFLWVGVSPFVDRSHFTQRFFPPTEYGIAIPVVIVSLLFVVGLTTSALHVIGQTGMTEELRRKRDQMLHDIQSSAAAAGSTTART